MKKMTTPLRLLVVDDHEAVLAGLVSNLQAEYETADIRQATTTQATLDQLADTLPNVLVIDLALPENPGDPSEVDTGINLLRQLLAQYPELNIVVQSANIKSLVRLKPAIDSHQGGFTIIDKRLPMKELLVKVDWALQGVIYTPRDMRNGVEVRPEWLDVLQLAFKEGLQDKAIAERMSVAERTVRYYWSKLQNALDVYPEAGKNVRIQTGIRAREEGLID
ncbi:response regulator receiver domain protein [Synechococcus sp. PCC 7335]|uniref:response regulator transcription factor n=1 Tax=Synechococcus sp. (strain ATCC 29403 / PCC 7335) TaxID=91464 RepID=UPI00017ED2D8|nr:response regulator transcription factor [Synechococcus sp. PCC 7335]EDX82676.1 response regulator receiver domain protein [Synechococcus sp. PCC 7335]